MSSSVLAIETSTPHGSVAVVCDGEVCFEKTFTSERSHNSQLFAPLREALEACVEPLRAVVVGTGPASYTGVRIGIAAAQGVALSRGVEAIGLSSVLAAEGRADVVDRLVSAYSVCGDARRGTYFVAEVRDGALVGIETMDAERLRRRHAESRDAAERWCTFDAKTPLGLEGIVEARPSATRLAMIAAKLSSEEIQRLACEALEPVYLAAPFITMPKK